MNNGSVMRAGRMAASVSMVLPAAIVAPMTAWLAVQTVVGLPGSQTNGRRPGADHLRFVVFVPAHDEASGIAATLVSLCAMEYPADAFAVHVVADNCTDATATVAREFEVEVHERDEPGNPGKGPALNWLFDRLSARGDVFDAVVVIDADTLVVADFLTAMDGALQQGADVAQGHYTVRDPAASTATSLRYAALACRHHLRARARTRLGASCGLYGNGMVFRRELLADRNGKPDTTTAAHPETAQSVVDAPWRPARSAGQLDALGILKFAASWPGANRWLLRRIAHFPCLPLLRDNTMW